MTEKKRIKAQNLAFHGIVVTFIIYITAIIGAVCIK